MAWEDKNRRFCGYKGTGQVTHMREISETKSCLLLWGLHREHYVFSFIRVEGLEVSERGRTGPQKVKQGLVLGLCSQAESV